jgi:hypothetical protein
LRSTHLLADLTHELADANSAVASFREADGDGGDGGNGPDTTRA